MAKSPSGRAQKSSPAQVAPRLGVFGAGGRMGQEVLAYAQDRFGRPAAVSISQRQQNLKDPGAADADVWVEFSSPQGFSDILDFCVKNSRPLVSGTTGLEKKHFQQLEKAAQKIPVLWSANMSLGVNILLAALEVFRAHSDLDFQIEEAHHRHKKDKPSGTAILFQKALEKITGKKIDTPAAIRGGGIFGIHKIWAMSDEETLTFEHTALNRRVFAKGAVEAAVWLQAQPKGLYQIKDMWNK